MKVPIHIKKLTDTAVVPTQGSEYAAGYDFYADIPKPIVIYPHETKKIGSGLSVEVDNDYWVALVARSGLATKEGLRPANCIGIIDPDYRGEVIAAIHNDSDTIRTITPGERIGQLIIMPRYEWEIHIEKDLNNTDRGSGGFGSTGK